MKNIFILTAIFSLLSFEAFAQSPAQDYQNINYSKKSPLPSIHDIKVKTTYENEFFFKPSISVEYSAPVISSGGTNSDFKTSHNIFSQLRDIENIALGFNFRVQKYLGFNLNWAQTELDNTTFQNVGALGRKALFSADQYNLSALFYIPVDKDFEVFLEGGVVDMLSDLRYTDTNGARFHSKAHETLGLYGAGAQINFNNGDALRFSVQKYSGKLALLDSYYTTIRIGYLISY